MKAADEKNKRTLSDDTAPEVNFHGASLFPNGDLDIDSIAMSTDNTLSELTSVTSISKPDAALGMVGDNFRKLSVLSSGGQGTIYRARDRKFNRVVAIKSIESGTAGTRTRDQFIAEAQLMAQIDHPGILPIYDLCTDKDSNLHLAMKLVSGKTLQEYLRKLTATLGMLPEHLQRKNERKSLRKRLQIFLRVCEAVSFAHQKGILHRDLKPANIMFGIHNEVYVLDWGLAVSLEHPEQSPSQTPQGTPSYLSPEVLEGKPADRRSDLYALGLVLFHMVYLKSAYSGEQYEVTQAILAGEYEKPVHRFGIAVSRDLTAIIRKAISRSPADRYPSVDALMSDLYHYLNHEEVRARPDDFWRGLRRRLDRRRGVLLVSSLVLSVFGLVCISIFLSHALYENTRQQMRDYALFEIHADGIASALAFDNRLRAIPQQLDALGKEAMFFMELPRDKWSDGKACCFYRAGHPGGPQVPADFGDSESYLQKISFDAMVYKTPPGEVLPNLEELLKQLSPLRESFFHLLSDSIEDPSFVKLPESEKVLAMRGKIKPPIGFVYLSLKNGVHFCYPFHNDYAEDYDPRLRSWYTSAITAKGNVSWTYPYVDNGDLKEHVITCVRKLYNRNGIFVGCIGADISFSRLLSLLHNSSGSGRNRLQTIMLVDANGKVLADTSGRFVNTQTDGSLEFPLLDDPELQKRMNKETQGQLFRRINGKETLHFFRKLETLPWYYVAEIDYDEMMNRQTEK